MFYLIQKSLRFFLDPRISAASRCLFYPDAIVLRGALVAVALASGGGGKLAILNLNTQNPAIRICRIPDRCPTNIYDS